MSFPSSPQAATLPPPFHPQLPPPSTLEKLNAETDSNTHASLFNLMARFSPSGICLKITVYRQNTSHRDKTRINKRFRWVEKERLGSNGEGWTEEADQLQMLWTHLDLMSLGLSLVMLFVCTNSQSGLVENKKEDWAAVFHMITHQPEAAKTQTLDCCRHQCFLSFSWIHLNLKSCRVDRF